MFATQLWYCWFCEQIPEILIFYLHLIWNMGCDQISALLWIKDFLQQLLTKSDAISPVNTENSDIVGLY